MDSKFSKTASEVEGTTTSNYPAEFQKVVTGRRKRRVGDAFHLKNFGVNITELEPGASSALKHWHEKQDEFIYVLSGEILLRTDKGEETLRQGQFVGFPAGAENGHQLVNRSNQKAVYLEIGDRTPGEVVHYSEVDLAVKVQDGKYLFTRKDGSPVA
ncbi:cupin [Leptospira perolatii]|uniref:Cupin n=1 Tax=Leptospira perolatii TaxID=2023191 RepID=A0A2M9ZIX5_9LEPT|nr:cupin domain-containing protein [Leptospira perolatii]PJZ69494.1 cupin [Leptospira perolatii]PJZ72009.1 cupin [Leptospira perolatii]